MGKESSAVTTAGWIAVGAAVSVMVLGVTVAAGWGAGNLRLIYAVPGLPPMPFPAAVVLALSGAALLAATLGWNRVALVVGIVVAVRAAVSLLEWQFGIDFDIEGIVVRHLSPQIPFPGRIPPSAALCLVLAAGGTALLSALERRGRGGLTGALSGSAVFALGFTALTGYLVGLPTYGWWKLMTRMAVHGAAGLTVLGVGLVALAWRREQARSAGLPRWSPLPVGLSALTATVCLWQAVEAVGGVFLARMPEGVTAGAPAVTFVLPPVTLALGLILTGLLSLAMHLLYVSRRRAQAAERAQAELEFSRRALQRANDELEERVRERTAELESFTYSVSHDLRAPLRHIDGFSKILLEEGASRLDPASQGWVSRIREGTEQMGRMVDDLLNLSRMGHREPDRQPTDMRALVEGVLDELRSEREDRQVEIRVGELPTGGCDPRLIRQVWVNLLSNALKFTRPRERVLIEVGCAEEKGGPVFYVRDNGVGFDMKYADKLFGVFQRLHRREEFEGTGVGLATVQRIIRRHGGRIWAEAESGRGATFFFTLGEEGSWQQDLGAATAAQG